MSDKVPAEEGSVFLADTEAAARPGGMTERGSGLDDERDEYDSLLASLGRTEDDDMRIAIHEAGHAVCARLLGHEVGGITVNPDMVRGSEGLCWGVDHAEAFAEGRGDVADVRDALRSVMPQAGEDRQPVADVFAGIYAQCIEFMAGRAAERMLLEGEPPAPIDDLRQARELAVLICSSDEALDALILHCDLAARDLLMPYGDLVMTLSVVLRIKRTLDGAEIDQIIRDVEARKELATEHRRRADWLKRARSEPGSLYSAAICASSDCRT
ncbi:MULTISPECIES: hypothetical protein [Bradyrhizobium]|uniref:Peptidase M41 domain-containing protein n=1 Tax=Bradyrhizobium elkanii TaxID=29448 RepID=A0A4U6RYW5_BRAEL|nr:MULTISPECIES: hypothetical protein [Bradyrhizobium]MTV16758.1 hypothetical protein [Bradyrhizobium sp. BR2003]TKV80449.1 hypothetical protein FDV58_16995 [Bradyrhizobium elkanii]